MATEEVRNGVKNTSLSLFYRRKQPTDWTREDGEKVIAQILQIKSAQLHKSLYYGIELIHRITRLNSLGKAKFRDYALDTLSESSISFASQYLEMIADFSMYGQTSGVLAHYYNLCFSEELSVEKRNINIDDFVNFALVHSYITGVHNWLAAIVVEIESQESANGINDSPRLAKLHKLVDQILIYRPEIKDAIDVERRSRTEDDYCNVTDQFVPAPTRADDSDRLYELDRMHNSAESLTEKLLHVGELGAPLNP